MQHRGEQFGTENEFRDPRFAELDAEIKAEEAIRQARTSPKPPRQRRQSSPRVPATVRKEISWCAQQLRQYRKLFIVDPKLRDRAARFIRSLLPPKRKRGRPGIPSVTKAILMLKKLHREHPAQERREHWPQVYRQVIPNYATLTREQQRGQELLLREQVRSRRSQRRRRTRRRI